MYLTICASLNKICEKKTKKKNMEIASKNWGQNQWKTTEIMGIQVRVVIPKTWSEENAAG